MSYNHLFQTIDEFNSAYNGEDYIEPWVSFTIESSGLAYNKKDSPVPPVDYTGMPFTIEITSGSGVLVFNASPVASGPLYYSLNGGEYIEAIVEYPTETTVNVSAGDVIRLKGTDYGNGVYNTLPHHIFDERQSNGLQYSIYGNIMSLIRTENFANLQSFPDTSVCFQMLFQEHPYDHTSFPGLMSVENLILPATALTEYCYKQMFYGCNNITIPPALPATVLSYECYCYMFGYCTHLTTAPELPATTLAEACYSSMFSNCTSLTTAPELPASTLTQSCYSDMFDGCSNLNYIKCLATDIWAENCTMNWVDGVASSGTFVKYICNNDWVLSDPSGIPSNWDIETEGDGPCGSGSGNGNGSGSGGSNNGSGGSNNGSGAGY